ncbi:MAG TPA: glycoside hydrolase/phage tail family protein [Microvirga sp.]|jgi:hypothetical protein|nr:glycoside hydrolase/phage tail family protein [Microvirga sp.]
MATLVLQTVGAVVGGAVGGPIGAVLGRAAGGIAGAAIDLALLGGETRQVEGPRLSDVGGLTSTEGAPIPRVYGRARLGGQLVWATRLLEVVNTETERSGSLGAKGFGAPETETTTYTYFANLAVGICEGPIAFVRRVWADGREIDLTGLGMRVHRGTESQEPDPLIVAKEGADRTPAYRGLAYVVFEGLALAPFGNRVPQFSFEVVRTVGGLNEMIRAVCLIPGASEFGYAPEPVTQDLGLGATRPENRHQLQRRTDAAASLDALEALCPNLRRVSLVVSWFGDDLRAGTCTIAPRVEIAVKATEGATWSVAGLDREAARVVSLSGGAPAYGGTPSDASVVALIQTLKTRGIQVVLYPFVMMDVPAGNALPNPHDGAAAQPPYPWRGRITCAPAPGQPGSPDGTAEAAAQVAAFFEGEWGLRRLVLQYADLAVQAGGVDGFVIGSELVGLTRVQGSGGAYPAVERLMQLAADVRAVVGPDTRITYAADWTEYGAHVRDGGDEIRFPLDPLWAHPAIDAVGIDYYPPIADWRDGPDHLDRAEARSPYDRDYLRARLASGEAFDWFYESRAKRNAQDRTPITDGAYGKPWIYRAKDLVSWWSEPHVERAGGAETTATAWVPMAKPIWLTEVGIPAVDKGANGPNVFPDPKSSESAVPPFSSGARDDLIQARGLEAILSRFDPDLPGFAGDGNPVSPVYGGRMVERDSVSVWAWDARPFPAFPDFTEVWADGGNWETGHWITGRLEGVPLDRLVCAILKEFDLDRPGDLLLDGLVDGYVIDRPMSARAALEPLCRLYGIDAAVSGGRIDWRGRGAGAAIALDADAFVLPADGPALRLVRAQETELPHQVEIGFTEGEGEYRRAEVASRRLSGTSRREARADVAVVTRRAEAQRLADIRLQDLWAGREGAEFALSPRRFDVEPGDVVALPTDAGPRLHRVVRIADGPVRRVTTRAAEPAVFAAPAARASRPLRRPPPLPGKPLAVVLDLPVARGTPPALQHLAVAADPWPGAATLWRSGDGESFSPAAVLTVPAVVGRTLTALARGALWRWDRHAALDVRISSGSLAAVPDEAALAGANLFALQGPDGRWEILSAASAELIGERTYRLSRLIRGLAGSEPEAGRAVPAGATIVRLDEAVVPLAGGLAELGRAWRYRLSPAGRDHADPAAVAFAATAGPDALKPLPPVRASARRSAEGVTMRWIRRTRQDGDPWDPLDVPLAEEAERYEVDVIQGGAVVRILRSGEAAALYPAAEELADFGMPQSMLSLRIVQMSAAVGRGFPLETIVVVS